MFRETKHAKENLFLYLASLVSFVLRLDLKINLRVLFFLSRKIRDILKF